MKSLFTLFPEPIAQTLGATLMHSIWQLALASVILLFALMLIPSHRSKLRYNLAFGTLILMVALPIGTWIYQSQQIVPNHPTLISVTVNSPETFAHAATRPSLPEEAGSFLDSVSGFFQANGQLLALLWLMGAMVFGLRTAGGFWYLRKLRRNWSEPSNMERQAMLHSLAARMKVKRRVSLLESSKVSTPIVIGTLQPAILLPAGMMHGLSTQELEYMLAHELAHILRRDFLMNVFQTLAEILLFFHPAVWVVSRIVREERENCVDEMVVNAFGNKKEYATALLNLESLRSTPRLAPAANGGQLLRRVKRIMGVRERKSMWSAGIVTGLFALLVIVTLVTGLGEKVKAAVFNHPVEELLLEDQDTHAVWVNKPTQPHQLKKIVLKSVETVVDTPKMVVTLLENGKEVRLTLDEKGELVSVQDNGKDVSPEKFEEYQQMASVYFQKYGNGLPAVAPPPARVPNPPAPGDPFQGFGQGFTDLFNGLGDMMAEMPIFDENGAFARQMEELAQNLAMLPMDGQEPDSLKMLEFERKMEQWGERFEQDFGKDMEAWGEKWEKWGEQFGADMESRFDEDKMEAWSRNMEREIEAKVHAQDWEAFGERMEQLGEEIEAKMEADAERLEAQAEQMKAKAEANRINTALKSIERDMVRDDLIDSPENYKLRINDKGMWVNGKKVEDKTHRQYLRKLEELTGEGIDSDNEFSVTKNIKHK